jgi:hypothetical protein
LGQHPSEKKEKAMPRICQGSRNKGSQKWIRHVVNQCPEVLNCKITAQLEIPTDDRINWLSPLANDAYAEYQDQEFLALLKADCRNVPLQKFWPKGGPVWDALGRSDSGNLLLVEAKSHIGEMVSPKSQASPQSKALISKSLKECKKYLRSKSNIDWARSFYQYTNRLAHLYFLRELNGWPSFLIFVYFVNDKEMRGPESEEEWRGAIKLLRAYLGVERTKLTPFMTDVFIDVKSLPVGRQV